MAVSSSRVPHDLKLVIDFVNTLDIEQDTDAIATPGQLAGWLGGRTCGQVGRLNARDHSRAISLREALRSVLLAHNGGEQDPSAHAELERIAEQGRLSVQFRPDGTVGVAPRAGDLTGALASLLVPVAEAAADGSWARVKACPAEGCQWAFYDHSRNRSGRWCDMAVCGNRTKVRVYRGKREV